MGQYDHLRPELLGKGQLSEPEDRIVGKACLTGAVTLRREMKPVYENPQGENWGSNPTRAKELGSPLTTSTWSAPWGHKAECMKNGFGGASEKVIQHNIVNCYHYSFKIFIIPISGTRIPNTYCST